MTNLGFGAVAREDADGVTEGEDFFTDSVEEGGGMATWKIGATDASSEEDIAAEEDLGIFFEEAETAVAVAWDFEDLEVEAVDDEGGGGEDLEAWGDGFDIPIEAEIAEEIGLSDHGFGVGMVPDLAMVLALDASSVPDVVDVAVGEEEGFYGVAVIGEPRGGVLWGVDEDAVFGKKEAICVKDSAGEGVDLHSKRAMI